MPNKISSCSCCLMTFQKTASFHTNLSRHRPLPACVDHLTRARCGHAWARGGVGLPRRRRRWGFAWLLRPLLGKTISRRRLGGSLGGSLQHRLGWFLHRRLQKFLRPLFHCFVRVGLRLEVSCHTNQLSFIWRYFKVCSYCKKGEICPYLCHLLTFVLKTVPVGDSARLWTSACSALAAGGSAGFSSTSRLGMPFIMLAWASWRIFSNSFPS